VTEKVHKALINIFGSRVTNKPIDLQAYSRDISPAREALASFVVKPQSTDEISKLLRVANKYNVPVYVRGGGTSHWAGWLPVKGGVLVDMRSMNKIIEINEKHLTATVQAGCTWYKLEKELKKRGLAYLASELGGPSMTVGGSIVKAGGGPYGTCKYGLHGYCDVVALEVVLPTGEVIRTGSQAYKNVPPFDRFGVGPDLTSFFIGSEGTLGIITEVTLRVRPAPEKEEYLYFVFKNWKNVEKVGSLICRPFGDELAYTFYAFQEGADLENIHCFIHVYGYSSEEAELRVKKIKEICGRHDGKEQDPEPVKAMYESKWFLSDIFERGVWHFVGGSVPINNLVPFVEVWKDIVINKYKFLNCAFGAWPYPRAWLPYVQFYYKEPDEWDLIWEITDVLTKEYVRMGMIPYRIGGPEGFLPYVKPQLNGYYEFLKRLKKFLDPNNILQPGILIDQEEEP